MAAIEVVLEEPFPFGEQLAAGPTGAPIVAWVCPNCGEPLGFERRGPAPTCCEGVEAIRTDAASLRAGPDGTVVQAARL